MGRVVIGLVKGLLVGALIGFGALKLGVGSGSFAYVVQGVIGFAVGLVCGKPLWRQETLWTPVVKGVFGLLVAIGLTWVARKVLMFSVPLPAALGVPDGRPLADVPLVLGALIGAAYGIFVEVDDGGKSASADAAKPAPAKK
jgi:hypothetical protein